MYNVRGRMLVKRALKFFRRLGGASAESHVDATYYRSANEDVAAAGVDPYSHYMAIGWKEGRNPSTAFNTLWYRDRYLDGADINPLAHYLSIGQMKGFAPAPPSFSCFLDVQRKLVAPLLDAPFYARHVGKVLDDPVGHYLSVGWYQGLAPASDFDPPHYIGENAFLKGMAISPLYHHASQQRLLAPKKERSRTKHLEVSVAELRGAIEPEFDASYYLKAYPDVRRSKLEPLPHYIEHGWREGRNPNELFDDSYYRSANPEVETSGINPFYHYLVKGRSLGLRPNPVGIRTYPVLKAPSPSDWEGLSAKSKIENDDYVVIMPVYKGYDETLAAIYAALSARNDVRFALHIIDDGTPDLALKSILAELAMKGLFSYSCNNVNLGFVKSVNIGLRLFSGHDVILLNSDAVVFDGWLDRLDRHAKSDPTIATITPLSNNATICSYPLSNSNNVIEPECAASEIDRLTSFCNAGRSSDIPTGVGFCFFMSQASREAVGLFDEDSFGRGYGEENDFCLRASKAGFHNILAEDIFVYHAGKVSFAEFVAEEYEPGQVALHRKHPDYIQRLRQFQNHDPSEYGRMRLDLYRMAQALPRAMIMVSHALKGGIHTHLDELEAALRGKSVPVIHIRVGVLNRWNLDIRSSASDAPYCPNLRPMPFNQIKAHLLEFFGWLRPCGIHIHSLFGLDWTATEGFLDLVRESSVPYFFTLHDYSIVCHRNNLVKPDGHYCGLPEVAVCESCVLSDRGFPEAIDPKRRRRKYADFLDGATAVYAPSQDIVARLKRAGYSYPVEVRPHAAIAGPVIRSSRPKRDKNVTEIVTLGAIGIHKGSQVILGLARDAQNRALPIRFSIIGYSDPSGELGAFGVTESGIYASNAEAFDLVADIAPDFVFLPSIWPETFCYTLSMAFALDIPPVVFNLGAQSDRVHASKTGYVLPYALINDIGRLNDELLALAGRVSGSAADQA